MLNGSSSAGKDLVQYAADGSSSQQWKIVSVGGDIYELKNINSGLVADVEGGSGSNGAHVIQWSDNNAANQRWRISSCIGQEPSSIGDRVWDDANRSRVQDAGESGIGGVSVALWVDSDNNGSHDTLVATTTTDANGNYSFSGLDASKRYVVKFTLPVCYAFTTPNVGNDNSDSDVSNFVYDGTELISVTAGQANNSVDAGMYNSLSANANQHAGADANQYTSAATWLDW
ncbi:MAG: SdrD B-like domain-containing protein [Caldilineaceae bacterium]